MVVITEHLPESSLSSSSTHDHNYRYDMFLSFRGADTRNSFTDHLYNTLLEADINTFLDDEEIETGEPLKPELDSAIKSSKASIIVLSKNYASSTWCLDELALILEQMNTHKHVVIPIFYHVEPTDVRKQLSSFGKAMEKHKKRMEAETDEEKKSQWAQRMELWKRALTQVADLKGKNAKDRKETEFITEVVADIDRRLGLSLSNTMPVLIGLDHCIEFIGSWLTDGCDHTADILTIVGMGGIGKTSLAKYVFRLHHGKFDKSSFIEGVNTRCKERFNGLLDLQMQLHKNISKITMLQDDVDVYTSMIEKALARKRVFIVLDDIESPDQLDALLGSRCLYPGSKIIITTKDASLTERCALFNLRVQPKHTPVVLNVLCKTDSLKLLCIHAFKSQKPKKGYEKVSEKLVKYCGGHPLALEVLGRSLHKRYVAYWEEFIQELHKESDFRINKVLEMSFHSLPSENDMELFKHIACFFVGKDRELTETILNACGIKTRSGITILTERCLLSIGLNNQLMMHSLIQEMGRNLVRKEFPQKPWKRSRLWHHEESFKVLKQKKGKGNLLGLALDMRMLDKKKLRGSFELETKSLSKMDNLMLLQLIYVELNGSFKNFPEELRWLCMHGSPLKSLPPDLPMENLVVLDMSYSNIESFGMFYSNQQLESEQKLTGSWLKDKRLLGSLRILDLSFCEHLRIVSGFFELPKLERLIVGTCISLIDICESLEHCVELVLIDMSYCRNLKRLPRSLGKLNKVKTLLLDGCNLGASRIEVVDMDSPKMLNEKSMGIKLQASSSATMEALPRDLKSLAISLPSSLVRLSLKGNNMSNDSFPMDFSSLSMLKELCLDGNPITSMPNCVRSLPRIETLSMYDCKMLTSVEHPPRTLKLLSHNSYSNSSQPYQSSLQKLVFDPEMSQLLLLVELGFSTGSWIQIDGIVKIQPMACVEENLLCSLEWRDTEFIEQSHTRSQTQMYYEFGIFSTLYEGKGIPHWIKQRRIGTSISFTIPSSSNKLRGLNFCFVQALKCVEGTFRLPDNRFFRLPLIKICNIAKNHTWIYKHCIESITLDGERLIFLSHWLFGMNEMEAGDEVSITVTEERGQVTRQCGIDLVYDDDDGKTREEEDALGYYKSWNHIIGGDLSPFQETPLIKKRMFNLELSPRESMTFLVKHDRYDIFISFRGADTRKSFTCHLYKALVEADYNTFLDDEEIETGEPLKQELESAIKSSRASVIVLSKNYAASTWCLEELVLILEQQESFDQIVIPIFYHVEPTDVRKQQSSFGEAMEKHKKRMEVETDAEKRSQWAHKIKLWKSALTQVAGLKGKDANDRVETKFIEEIVKDIYNRLGAPLGHTTLPQLIGMKYHIERITSWLKDGSLHTADIYTILGMGGIGKTSLAKHVYELHHREYRSSFVGDISRRCDERYHGLLDVQKQLCDDISKKSSSQSHDVFGYTCKIENALALEKVLLVLDDIDTLDQLDALLGNKGFHPGSKVIITTKDASLVRRCALFKTEVKLMHTECTLKGLSVHASLKLLCHHAFASNYPNEGYEEVSEKLARYCEGHPLALEVLGKSLYNRDVGEWEDSLELLKKEPHSRVKKALQMSFDSLPFKNDKDLFKHIACFFVGMNRDVTETILTACDINTRSGIKNLIDRFLLSVRGDRLMMHQLVQEMGRDLVRQESPDKPWERSRLCCHEESLKVLEQKKGSENVLGLALDMRMLEKDKLLGLLQPKIDAWSKMDNLKLPQHIYVNTDALNKMDYLKLLQLNYMKINGSYKNISKELRWLCMHGFQLKYIPSELPMENLVVLDMSHSNIESFNMSYSLQRFASKLKGWIGSSSKDKQLLRSLKILDLSYCAQLHRVGGFFDLPMLERLILKRCISLIEVCESVEQCVELVHIDLSHCYKLKKLPISLGKLKNVKTLLLDDCAYRASSSHAMEVVPSSLKFSANSLPTSLRVLSLANNNLSNESFPMDLSSLSLLKKLYLDGNPIVSMPTCVRSLPGLEVLSMEECEMLMAVELPPRTLRELSISSFKYNKTLLKVIKFDPDMSPIRSFINWKLSSASSFEIDGMIKIQPMAAVEERVLRSLGWAKLDFIKERSLQTYEYERDYTELYRATRTQMHYEFGIFSTMYEEKEMPDWINCRSKGALISFTIPSSPNNLRGLNFCYIVETFPYWEHEPFTLDLPIIEISNNTKKHIWIYHHYITEVTVRGKCCLCFLSHWMFGPTEMEDGDYITIGVGEERYYKRMKAGTIIVREDGKLEEVKQLRSEVVECGVGLVYDDDGMIEEEEDALGYYKSWNHIIGGDLSDFQLTTGQYILNNRQFKRKRERPYIEYHSFVSETATYKEHRVAFKAFSQKQAGGPSRVLIK